MDRKIFLSNFGWRVLERVGAKVVTFTVAIILARLLEPSIYGTIALITVFIAILGIFLDGGFGTALIQKKDADNLDFSTVFYFNIAYSTVLYFLLFLFAPIIDSFYGNIGITPVIRVMGLSIIVAGIKNVQHAYVAKNMMFRKFFFSTLGGTIGSAIIGIYMAYNGFGIWALAIQHLFSNIVGTFILWVTVPWRPQWKFSRMRLKDLFSFGWKLLISKLIYRTYSDIRQLLIGKLYSPADLAFYNQGYKFPDLINTEINTSMTSILLPAMSNVQTDRIRVKSMLRRINQLSQYIMGAFVIGLAACAEPFVELLFTEKWLPCVPYLQIFCIAFFPGQIGNANMNVTVALGRSDIRLRTEILKTTVNLVILFITAFISPFAVAVGLCISFYISTIICIWPNVKLINYSVTEQFMDILPNMGICLVMAICMRLVTLLKISALPMLLLQAFIGLTVYIGLSIVIKSESFYYLFDIITKFLKRGGTT